MSGTIRTLQVGSEYKSNYRLISLHFNTNKAYHSRILLVCKCVILLHALTAELNLASHDDIPLFGHVQDVEVEAVGLE